MEYHEIVLGYKVIRGFFYPAVGKDLVVMAHGIFGNKVDHHFMMPQYAREINGVGFNVYRFDFLGTGDSDGLFCEEESIFHQIEQLCQIATHFINLGYRIHLFGYSLGGVIASHVTRKVQVSSLFLLSPAGNFPEILKNFCKQGKALKYGVEFNGFLIPLRLIQESKRFDFQKGLEGFVGAVKIVQGEKDQYVSLSSLETYKRIYPQGDLVIVKDADHCFSTVSSTNAVRKEIKAFYGSIRK